VADDTCCLSDLSDLGARQHKKTKGNIYTSHDAGGGENLEDDTTALPLASK
jgi:hypothetical protein